MKNKIYSVFVSLVVIPLFAIGQFLGLLVGQLQNWFFNYFLNWGFRGMSGPSFWTELLPYIISGGIAGAISGYAVSKIYKKYDLNFVMIVPALSILVVLYYVFTQIGIEGWSFKRVQDLAQQIATIGIYYFLLKEKDFT